MPRKQLGKFMRGPHGLGKIFRRDRFLRRTLTPRQRRYVMHTLAKRQKGKGITFRSGPGSRSELDRVAGQWRRKKDPINRKEAKLIKKRLKEYGRSLEQNPDVPRASGRLLRRNSSAFGSDPRAILDPHGDGTFRGDSDDRPSLMYGGSSFDDNEMPEGSGYDHQGHLKDLRNLDDHFDSGGLFDRPGDSDTPAGHDAT